ncbi:MAG: DNA replication/repair protein RecF [Ruminococcus sp.]|nr:DNA replication/repair protein RecF [Ruminococcus sp.]
MFVTKLNVDGFKNLKKINIKPHQNINIFCGKNAQGKTNLIESIWLCSGVKSFRNTKDKSMIDINGEVSNIELSFKDKIREQVINYNMAKPNFKDKNVYLNGVKLKAPSNLFGNFDCVIFTPEDLELSKGSPDNRRKFLDLSVSQIKNSYNSIIIKYENILEQRNALLKNINQGKSSIEDLDIWDTQLASMGAYISLLRYNYTKKLNIFAKRLFSEISDNKENLELCYFSTVYDNIDDKKDYRGEMTEEYLRCLKNSVKDDIRAGFTSKGVHRDDLVGYINGLAVRDFASQGQHRSLALILKLAQAYILTEETKDAPCILLDDVLSELDVSRQKFVISKINDMQVFITCCNMNIPFDKNSSGKIFFIENGRIVKKNQG